MNTSVKNIVAIGIGSAIFFLLARFVSIPVFVNTNFTFQYAALAFFAVVFGPIVGALVGFIGHTLADLAFGWGIWWTWVVMSGVVGCAFGLIMKGVPIEKGSFDKTKQIIRFVVLSSLVHVIAWGALAPTLDIFIYQQDPSLVYTQGVLSGLMNISTTATVGAILLIAYSKTQIAEGSLTKE